MITLAHAARAVLGVLALAGILYILLALPGVLSDQDSSIKISTAHREASR